MGQSATSARLRQAAQRVVDADDWYEEQCSTNGPETQVAFDAVWNAITMLRLALEAVDG